MARRRFFVDRVHKDEARLTGEDAQHLTRVLRVEAGQRYEISDNESAYLAEITDARRDRVVFEVREVLPAPPPSPEVILFASIFKFDRFEWMIEKATELGVTAIVPVAAARSEKGLFAAAAKRSERWRKIARESSQQSRRLRLPEIQDARQLAGLRPPSGASYLLDENPDAPPLLQVLPPTRSASDAIGVLVGPEGGWTESERAAAVSDGWQPASLGPLIVRAETAAVAALAILQNAWLPPVKIENWTSSLST